MPARLPPAGGAAAVIAALYLPLVTHRDKHLKVCLEQVQAQRYRVTTLASTPEAVISAAVAGLVHVVVAATRWAGGSFDEVEQALAASSVKLDIVRDLPARRRVEVDPTVTRMAGFGLTAAQIAEVLGVNEHAVHLTLIRQPAGSRPANVVDLGEARRARRAS